MFLFRLRNCCRRWFHRQYDDDRKSLPGQLFDSDITEDQRNIYATNNEYFPIAPFPPYTPDEIYESGRSSIASEKETDNIRFISSGLHPIVVVPRINNIRRNIVENYIINETQNYYYIQKYSSQDQYHTKHISDPPVTKINMAVERITVDPDWETANPFEFHHDQKNNQSSSSIKQATNEIIAPNPTLFQENKNYSFDDHTSSTTSEMSGHDSESIYLFPSKKQSSTSFDDEAVGIDEVEIKDFRHSKKANNTYSDILSPIKYSLYIHSILPRPQK